MRGRVYNFGGGGRRTAPPTSWRRGARRTVQCSECMLFDYHCFAALIRGRWCVSSSESFAACSSSTSVGTGMVCTVLGAPSGFGCGCGCWFSQNGSSAANFPNVSVVICRSRSLRQRFRPRLVPLRHQLLPRSAQVSLQSFVTIIAFSKHPHW